MSKIITKDFLKRYISECQKKNVLTLTASSSFFFLLSMVPLLYLIATALSYIFTDGNHIQKVLTHFSPIIPTEIMPSIKYVLTQISKSMQENHQNLFLHRIFLVISSLSFFGSIWKAIEIITEEKASNSLFKTLKSLGGLLVSFILCAGLIVGPIVLNSIQIMFKKGLLKDINVVQKFNFSSLQIHGVNLFSTIMLVAFFFIFFKYILNRRAKFLSLLSASAMFTFLIIVAKFAFLYYIALIKDNLIGNFGSFYSLILVVFWVYISILSFYISIIFAITHSTVINESPEVYIDIDL